MMEGWGVFSFPECSGLVFRGGGLLALCVHVSAWSSLRHAISIDIEGFGMVHGKTGGLVRLERHYFHSATGFLSFFAFSAILLVPNGFLLAGMHKKGQGYEKRYLGLCICVALEL